MKTGSFKHSAIPLSDTVDHSPGPQWETGFWKRFPILSLSAWVGCICCTVVAVVILYLSNGQPVEEWSGNRQPTVLLAYTSTIANALIGFAFAEAIVISYWCRVLGGTKLSKLHYHWTSSQELANSLKALIRGETLTVALGSPLVWKPGMIAAAKAYNKNSPIQLSKTTCSDCLLSIPAFGFQVNCTKTPLPFTFDLNDKSFEDNSQSYTDVFNSTVSASYTADTMIEIAIVRKTGPECSGDFEKQVCNLLPASVSYDVRLDGPNVTLVSPRWQDDTVIHPILLSNGIFAPSTQSQSQSNLLQPLVEWGRSLYTSEMYIRHVLGWDLELKLMSDDSGGTVLANLYMQLPDGKPSCSVYFADPMDDIINGFRELAFRASVQAAADNGTSSMQSLPYTTSNSTVVYAIDATNLAVAVIIGLLAPIAALPLFWGWWRLGRKVSMSPLEIASSFYAGPRGGGAGVVFGRFGGNEEAVQLLKELGGARGEGHVRVVYGNLPQSDRLGLRLVSRTEE